MPATRDQIADVFAKHVERYGYGKTSVEDVAAELRISKKTIYESYSSKRDIYAYVVERIAAQESVRVRKLVARKRTNRAKAETLLVDVIRRMREYVLATEKAEWLQQYEIAREALGRAYGSVLGEIMTAGNAAGEFDVADVELVNGFIDGMTMQYALTVRERPDYDADAVVVACIMRMLGCGSGAGARVGKE
jgi:AcrR family transcriptional regulator